MMIHLLAILVISLPCGQSIPAEEEECDICEEVQKWYNGTDVELTQQTHIYYNAYYLVQLAETEELRAAMEVEKAKYRELKEKKQIEADKFLEVKDEIEKCDKRNLLGILDELKSDSNKQLSEENEVLMNGYSKILDDFFRSPVLIDSTSYPQSSDLRNYMKGRDYNKLLRGWQQYHDTADGELKNTYLEILKLDTELAKENGYSDVSEQWLYEEFKDTSMEENMDQILKDIFPFYKKVHAYVRSKLFDYYLPKVDDEETKKYLRNKNNPIPAHILGDMWAQMWSNIGDLVVPFPKKTPINITQILLDKQYDAKKLFDLAEEFYTSLGLDKMTDTFWNKSVIVKQNEKIACVASAYDLVVKDDYRIMMCTEMDDINYYTVHHEMGHIVNFMLYHKQPYVFKESATPAFSEAVGDTMILSARSRKHLKKIGFVEDTSLTEKDIKQQRINDLMQTSLLQICFLPFMYVLEKWRFAVFRGEITVEEFNKKWWHMRLKFNGVSPPVPRPDAGFDAGSKFHIPNQIPFIRYFFSYIGQFQFHQALCKAAGQTEDLDNCDIYESKAAGDKIKDFLAPGKSISWKELMKDLTGVDNFQSTAIVDYFKVLDEWLTGYLDENEIPIGWDGMWEV